jgi:hypothetical protein
MYLSDAEDPAGSCCNNNNSSADAIDLIVATAAGPGAIYISSQIHTTCIPSSFKGERKSIENIKADPEFVTVAWRKKIKKPERESRHCLHFLLSSRLAAVICF